MTCPKGCNYRWSRVSSLDPRALLSLFRSLDPAGAKIPIPLPVPGAAGPRVIGIGPAVARSQSDGCRAIEELPLRSPTGADLCRFAPGVLRDLKAPVPLSWLFHDFMSAGPLEGVGSSLISPSSSAGSSKKQGSLRFCSVFWTSVSPPWGEAARGSLNALPFASPAGGREPT